LPNSASSGIPQGETARHIRRFLVIGVLSVLCDLGTYALLLRFGLDVSVAKGISYVAGMVFGFFGNKFWTFESPQKSIAEPILYLVLYAVTMGVNVGINALVLNQLTGTFGPTLAKGVAFLFATGTTTILNFLGMRLLTFNAGIRARRELLRIDDEKAQ
jgi:putative flippase GtrA